MPTPRRAPPAPSLHQPPYRDALPAAMVFRTAQMPARAVYPQHRHAWGEFVYSFSGVIEVALADRHFMAPPQFGIWLPPGVEHRGSNRQAAVHSSLYVSPELCGPLPAEAGVIAVSPLMRALLDHLRSGAAAGPVLALSAEQQRLLQVLVDQIGHARRVGSYLPQSGDVALGALLQWLQEHPADSRSLAELAGQFHSTERTLSRRCQRDLGMSFAEWRQRLRVIKALPRLDVGEKVESIAFDLGYAGASAFTAMFRRMTGLSPDEHRRAGRAARHGTLRA